MARKKRPNIEHHNGLYFKFDRERGSMRSHPFPGKGFLERIGAVLAILENGGKAETEEDTIILSALLKADSELLGLWGRTLRNGFLAAAVEVMTEIYWEVKRRNLNKRATSSLIYEMLGNKFDLEPDELSMLAATPAEISEVGTGGPAQLAKIRVGKLFGNISEGTVRKIRDQVYPRKKVVSRTDRRVRTFK